MMMVDSNGIAVAHVRMGRTRWIRSEARKRVQGRGGCRENNGALGSLLVSFARARDVTGK